MIRFHSGETGAGRSFFLFAHFHITFAKKLRANARNVEPAPMAYLVHTPF
jgi:hypothetical protein